ncbi:MAG: hypothetical protein H7336_08020 [Bacteriovorax sp.]|nr:hypothetical protein [Bacteriovorax sp.]
MIKSTTLLDTLLSSLFSSQCQADFVTMKESVGIGPDQELALNSYFDFKLKTLAESAQDVCLDGDESELQRLLSHIWIEYRMEWIRYNTQMQYQTVVRGQAEPELCARGAVLSYLIGIIESLLSNEEIYWCTKLAAEPIEYMRSRSLLTSRMVQMSSMSGNAGQSAIGSLIQLRDELSVKIRNPLIESRFEKVMTNLEELFTSSTALTSADLHNSLEMIMTKVLGESKVPMLLYRQTDDDTILIPASTIVGLNDLFEQWIKFLVGNSLEESIQVRRDSQKNDHVTIQWRLIQAAGGRLILELEDDGLGKNITADFKNLPRDWVVEKFHTPGLSSKIIINFKGTELADMMVFKAQGPEKDFSFAIFASQVNEVLSENQLTYHQEGTFDYVRTTQNDEVYPLVDMSKILFGKKLVTSNNVFIKVTCEDKTIVIKAASVEAMVKDSMRIGPKTLFFVEGYLLYKGVIVSVIDVIKLKESLSVKHSVSKVS